MSGAARDVRAGTVLVIGIGNRYRRDDAAGLACAERLREIDRRGIAMLELEGEPTSLIDAWDGASVVYVIDAVSSGGEPGSVHRFDATREPPPAPFRHRGTHALSVADVVELARALDRLPERLVAYGIEGGEFGAGVGLSPEVERAARTVASQLLEELSQDGGDG